MFVHLSVFVMCRISVVVPQSYDMLSVLGVQIVYRATWRGIGCRTIVLVHHFHIGRVSCTAIGPL